MSYTLRDLPLPVKVVASVFLMAVGLGYGSAMVQLHMQDSKSGQPMPTVDDVIKKFTGKVKYDPANAPSAPVSRLEALIMGADDRAVSGQTMSPAFTSEDRAKGDLKFANAIKGKSEKEIEAVKAQRKGEQNAMRLWINTPDDQRKAAYTADRFTIPTGQLSQPITPAFHDGDAVKIKSLIDNRCATCHEPNSGEAKADGIPLTNYDQIAKFMQVNATPISHGYVKVEEPISITKLTQSTHAHLLSFAMLFSLTGLVFAFSSYPKALRVILGPWVVIAVFADVSLWWLARLSDEWGPFFAMGVVFTGGAAGVGVAAQIILSLFNMYGTKGKLVLTMLFALGGVLAGLVWVKTIEPELRIKIQQAQRQSQPASTDNKKDSTKPLSKGNTTDSNTTNGKPHVPINELDRLLTLPVRDAEGKVVEKPGFNGSETGTMARAFFDKDKSKVYPQVMGDPTAPQAQKDMLKALRQAELDAVLAWVRTPDAARKLAYETNSFAAPALAPKIAPEFINNGKVMVKSIIAARCAACHSSGEKQEDYPLTNYEELSKYLKPIAPAAAPAPPPAEAQPTPAKATTPIPPAKDD